VIQAVVLDTVTAEAVERHRQHRHEDQDQDQDYGEDQPATWAEIDTPSTP
jgi:hypothetical protein